MLWLVYSYCMYKICLAFLIINYWNLKIFFLKSKFDFELIVLVDQKSWFSIKGTLFISHIRLFLCCQLRKVRFYLISSLLLGTNWFFVGLLYYLRRYILTKVEQIKGSCILKGMFTVLFDEFICIHDLFSQIFIVILSKSHHFLKNRNLLF